MTASEPATIPLEARVASVIEAIRPAIRSDGGDLELVAVAADGQVQIRLLGACVGCPSADATLHHFIERALVEVPGVSGVIAVP